MLLRLDDVPIPGLLSIDGYLDIREIPDPDVAEKILSRHATLKPILLPEIDEIVHNLRAKTLPDIKHRCGAIRILTMSHPNRPRSRGATNRTAN